jgi:hypothetical protein
MYRNVPVSDLTQFRKLSAKQAQALLEQLDKWLSEHSAAAADGEHPQPRTRAGLGIFYFEDPPATNSPKEK